MNWSGMTAEESPAGAASSAAIVLQGSTATVVTTVEC
jgi:hypothetical protein